MTPFPIGTAFVRRYVLLGPIGRGGVSVVYQALDTVQGRHTAIKMLDPALARDPGAQERIRREAMITDRVQHPGVPRIYDYGDAPQPDGTVIPYVVMDLLTGTVLGERLGAGPLPWQDAVRIAADVADVLTVAHRRGVVHRDLTPANIMLTRDGAKIIDFGVAVTVRTPDLGRGPFVVPPPAPPVNDFAGPGEPADDVYALGVLLYQMVTGRSPYASAEPPPVASGTLHWLAPTPVLTVPGLPRALAEICRRCMAKRPADRPDAAATALEMWALILTTPAGEAPPGDPAPDETTVRLPRPPDHLVPPRALGRGPARTGGDHRSRPAWAGPTSGQSFVAAR